MSEMIVDKKEGLKSCYHCTYVQLNSSDMDKVEQFLSDNNIPNKVFMTASAAFCESQADSKLIAMCDPDDNNTENATEIALLYREHIGERMYCSLEKFIDFDEMDDFISKCFAKKLANDLFDKAHAKDNWEG